MNERSIFAAALERKTAGERQAYLDQACGGNVELRAQVEELLKADCDAGSFLHHPPAGIGAETVTNLDGRDAANSDPATGPLRFLEPCDKPDRIGKLVGKVGEYEVVEIVGQGGMGTVLRAFDTKLSRVVAVKVMAAELAANPTAVKRFLREATTAAAVVHDHVVTIHAVDDSHRSPFLVMEFVDGQTLQQKIDREGALGLKTILRIGAQVAAGLAAAHAQGLVHRDIKPSNILLENGVERVKITDFGLAHAVDDVRTTQAGAVVGTPEYMSPEQARGGSVDHRSDLFNLGCVLYAMCAGRPPFRAENTMAAMRRVCEEAPRPLSEIDPQLPRWLIDVIDKLIAKDAAERFQSAGEVAELLGRFLAHIQQPLVIPQPAAIRKARAARIPEAASRRRRWLTAAAAALLLCAGLTLAESTGVTHVAATVIRIVRGDGTLVVEIDDPNIQVLIDDEELVITGAGPKEFRLRPGEHRVQSVKDGKPVATRLITITRDGREVVKDAREAPVAGAEAAPVTRQVWADAVAVNGSVSPDGRYLAFTDWDTGDLAVRDLATGKNRRLTKKGTWSESSAFALGPRFSRDGTQLAYTWYDTRGEGSATPRTVGELRLIRVEGGNPRVVSSNAGPEPVVGGWVPDGKSILAKLRVAGEPRDPAATTPVAPPKEQFALIATEGGSVRTIKSFESRRVESDHFSLSPDGRTIAYCWITQPGGTHHDIFLIDVETGRETQVTAHAADKTILAWTPDGQRLLFDMERQGTRDAWMIRVAGGKPQGEAELVKKDLGAIVPQGFTRDGTFYFGSTTPGPSLFTATLDLEKGTSAATPLAAERFNIMDQLRLGDWSPDGEQLAYWAGSLQSGEMRIVSIKTGQVRVLKPNVNIWRSFRWSPDGRSLIAATSAAAGQKPGMYQIDAISGQAKPVFETRGGGQCVWSRDGRGIFYVRRGADGTSTLVSRDLQAQTEKEVLAPGNPAFAPRFDFWFDPSPDGRQLALLGEPNADSMALWLVPLDGGASRELLKVNTARTFAGGVSWTPDGRFILFIQLGGDETQRGLWCISANGGQPRKVALTGIDATKVTRLAVHPGGKQLALFAAATGKSEVWALENFLPPLKDSSPPPGADASAAKSKSAAAIRR